MNKASKKCQFKKKIISARTTQWVHAGFRIGGNQKTNKI